MAEQNSANVGQYIELRYFFFTNFHSRSIKFRLGEIRRKKQKLDAYFSNKFPDAFACLVAGIVKNRRNGDADAALLELQEQLADRQGIDVGRVFNMNNLFGDRIQGTENIEAAATRGSRDIETLRTPQTT